MSETTGPPAEGSSRVVVCNGDSRWEWWDYTGPQDVSPHTDEVFDIPTEQRDQWQAATDAWRAMMREISALMEARRKGEGLARGRSLPS